MRKHLSCDMTSSRIGKARAFNSVALRFQPDDSAQPVGIKSNPVPKRGCLHEATDLLDTPCATIVPRMWINDISIRPHNALEIQIVPCGCR